MALITYLDIQNLRGITMTATQQTAASVIIEMAQAEIESYLGRDLTSATYTAEEHEVNSGQTTVDFEHSPVTSISEITVNGSVWSTSNYVRARSGVEIDIDIIGLTTTPAVLTATYTAGFTGADQSAVKMVLTSYAARWYAQTVQDDADGAATISVEGYSVQYSGEGLSKSEMKRLSRFKRRFIRRGRISTYRSIYEA